MEDITGAEWNEIHRPMTEFNFELQEDGKTKGTFNAGKAKRESTQNAIRIVVQSVGGKGEGVLDSVEGLVAQDYRYVLKAVDEVVSASDGDFLGEEGKLKGGIS